MRVEPRPLGGVMETKVVTGVGPGGVGKCWLRH